MGWTRRLSWRALLLFAASLPAMAQDRVLVGAMSSGEYSFLIRQFALPAFPNQKFCSLLQLAPNVLTWAYVPTAAERAGDFSSFPAPLTDPRTSGSPFPGNVIPLSRIPATFAWRLPGTGPAPGEVCVPSTNGYPAFTTANYVTGLNAVNDVVRALPSTLAFSYRLGDPLPAARTFAVSTPGAQLRYLITPPTGWVMNNAAQKGAPAWLSYDPGNCCKTPGTAEQVSLLPATLVPGAYIAQLSLVAIGAISTPQSITVNLQVTAPPDYLVVSTRSVRFAPYVLGDPTTIPGPQQFSVLSLGSATTYSTTANYVTPRNTPWFHYSPSGGSTPGVITITLDANLVKQVGRGSFVGYIEVFAGSTPVAPGLRKAAVLPPPNSPQRVVVSLDVFPAPDLTVAPDSLTFSFTPGAPLQPAQTFTLNPVTQPLNNLSSLTFQVAVVNMDARDGSWLSVTPTTTGPSNRLTAELIGAGVQSLTPGGVHQAIIAFNGPGDKDVNTGGIVAVAVAIPPAPPVSPPVLNAVVSAGAGGVAGVSPGSWVAIFGQNLAPGTRILTGSDIQGSAPPVSLGGVSIQIDGRPAALSFVSPEQINALVPDDPSRGPVQVVVTSMGVAGNPFTVNLTDFRPAFFPFPGNHVAAQHADFSLVGVAPYAPGGTPARPGETIALYGTGFGPTGPATPSGIIVSTAFRLVNTVSVSVGGRPAAFVPFAGITGAGLTQINVTIPDVPDGDQPVIATVNGVSSPVTLLAIRR